MVKNYVWNLVKNPLFNRLTVHEDLAILKLTSAVKLSSQIQVACLPVNVSFTYPPVNVAGYAVGWGATSYGGDASILLRNVKLTIYNGTKYCSSYNPYINWSVQICSGNYSGGQDTCSGDSGGPLYILDMIGGKLKYILAGVTSYG